MNILHVIPGDLWAGAEAQVYYSLRELCKCLQHSVSVILFSKGELYTKLLATDVEVLLLDEATLSNAAICRGIRRQLIAQDVHIAHVHEYKSHMLTALAKLIAGQKECILFRTLHGKNVPSRFKSYLVLGIQNFFLLYMTDHLIAVSEELKKQLIRKKIKAEIHLLYNAVELSVPLPAVDLAVIRDSFGLSNDQFWIGTAARLEGVKNLQLLIEAARILRDKRPELDFHVSIFGDGSLHNQLESLILKYGLNERVILEGHNDDIIPVLQSLDVFTLTSLHEGLPMSLLEAMSVGTVPVCTAVGGMQEVISHGEDGFLVDFDNPEELAKTFAHIYSEKANLSSIRLKAREKIKQSFSVKQNCQQLLALYEKSVQALTRS